MKTILSIFLSGILALPGFAQSSKEAPVKAVSTCDPVKSAGVALKVQKLRIEQGEVWINERLAETSDLPEGLRAINPDHFFQASISGPFDFRFTCEGKDFLLREGKIYEYPPELLSQQPENNEIKLPEEEVPHDLFYSKVKREFSSYFSNLQRAAELHDRYVLLMFQYQKAPDAEKPAILESLRTVMESLFDLNHQNDEDQLDVLEKELDEAREMLEFRRRNKEFIIEKKLTELKEVR